MSRLYRLSTTVHWTVIFIFSFLFWGDVSLSSYVSEYFCLVTMSVKEEITDRFNSCMPSLCLPTE